MNKEGKLRVCKVCFRRLGWGEYRFFIVFGKEWEELVNGYGFRKRIYGRIGDKVNLGVF